MFIVAILSGSKGRTVQKNFTSFRVIRNSIDLCIITPKSGQEKNRQKKLAFS